MKSFFRSGSFWFGVLGVLVLGSCIWISTCFWGWLHPPAPTEVSNSETLRNVGLLTGGLLAFVFAGWRGWVAERQANAAQSQAETTQRGLLNERYQKGSEMLGSDVLSVRLGGIYALQRLAKDYPEQYHIQIMRLFCAFVTHTAEKSSVQPSDSEGKPTEPSPDLQAVMDAIGARREGETNLERLEKYRLDLRRAKLSRTSLARANLSGVRLAWASLEGADLGEANLSKAGLNQADLTGATLGGANLHAASIRRAILESAVFWTSPGPLRFISYYNALRERGVLSADLSAAKLEGSDLSGASLQGADLAGAFLTDAILDGANLSGANLSGGTLSRTRLSGVKMHENGETPASGLTQEQLDQACSNPNNPPDLGGFVLDAATGKPLVWRGKPPSDGPTG